MAKAWYPDPGMAVLNGQMRIKFPGIVIGTIGDKAHEDEDSDHNPEEDGSVDASDYMLGAAFSRDDCNEFVTTLVEHRDKRIAYIIWERRIISSTVQPWIWRPYGGKDPHTEHSHLSVNDKYPGYVAPWNLTKDVDNMFVEKGDASPWVLYWQNVLIMLGFNPGAKDGVYGPKMEAAVNASRAKYNEGPYAKITEWHAAVMHRDLA